MTRAAKQKAARQSTAAYAASQPLFDALRIGFNRVGEQKAQLSIARDIVQHLHVKIVDQDNKAEQNRHERYIDCAVKAWRSATEIYEDIFQSLAKATAAEASEGREARTGHAAFAEMARTAAEAKSAAGAFVLYEDVAKAGANEQAADSEDDSDEDDSDEDTEDLSESDESSVDTKAAVKSEPVNIEPTNPVLLHLLGKRQLEPPKEIDEPAHKAPRLSDNIKYDAQGRKILWEKGAEKPNVPYGTLGGREKKAWKAEKRRQKREKRQVKSAAKMMEKAAAKKHATGANGIEVEDTSRPVHDRDFISLDAPGVSAERVVPAVHYQDVTAEVEQRLKEKEARREAKKKEKKRKRVSGESVENNDEAESANKVDKPAKKKKKSEVVNGEAESAENGVKEEKGEEKEVKKEKRRKSDGGGEEAGGEGEGRKKRKKTKE